MERHRLKNIIIFILLLLNICLLVILLLWRHDIHTAWKNTTQQLSELFAADNIALDPASIPDDSAPLPLTFSLAEDECREIAAYFLGKGFTYTQQANGSLACFNTVGTAIFHPDGTFDIAGTLPGDDVSKFCRQFCQKYHYSAPDFDLDSDGSGNVTVFGLVGKLVAANCSLTFTIKHGVLIAVSGCMISSAISEAAMENTPMSAPAALNRFLSARQESGAVVSVIEAVDSCYLLQNTAANIMTLTPAWRIETDTSTYYVNAVSGELSSFSSAFYKSKQE